MFGLFRDMFEDAFDWAKEKVEKAVDWVRDILSRKRYDEDDVDVLLFSFTSFFRF